MRLKAKVRLRLRVASKVFYLTSMFFLALGIGLTISLNDETNDFAVNNLNLEKSVSSEEISASYEALNKKQLEPVFYSDFLDAVENSKYFPTSFEGKLTHYGPDCELCGGHLGCNGQDARNGNIYYEDEEYGTLRIVATSKAIPCGSIIRINVDEYDPNGMYAIVLDRGVGYGVVDLLKTSQKANSPVRTLNNVTFDIVRYGY